MNFDFDDPCDDITLDSIECNEEKKDFVLHFEYPDKEPYRDNSAEDIVGILYPFKPKSGCN